jgi:hypothetical protein
MGRFRYQPVIRDRHGRRIARIPMNTCVAEEIEKAIEKEMQRFGVSRSFVIAVACAEVFNIDLGTGDYHASEKLKPKQ